MSTLRALLIGCCFLLATGVTAQDKTAVSTLKEIVQTPELARFFDGIFNTLGIIIQETGEQLTAYHEGDRIRIESGMNPTEVDFVLPLALRNISDLVKQASDGSFDEVEATQIARVFFTPFTRVTLKHHIMSANAKRKAAGIEELIHVKLLFPDGTEAAAHTLIYAADQWVVIEGLVGVPERSFTLKQDQALTYQRKVFAAMQTDTRKEWMSFLKWYRDWRENHSVKTPSK